MDIHERISLVIKQRNVTRSDFAKAIKVTSAAVTQMCSGKTNPSPQTISLICQNFRVSENWLRTGEGKMDLDDPQSKRLENFFADVLATAPDERSAFVASLDTLPPEFWGMVADLARAYADNLAQQKEKED